MPGSSAGGDAARLREHEPRADRPPRFARVMDQHRATIDSAKGGRAYRFQTHGTITADPCSVSSLTACSAALASFKENTVTSGAK